MNSANTKTNSITKKIYSKPTGVGYGLVKYVGIMKE
jgi:hypothetical protein